MARARGSLEKKLEGAHRLIGRAVFLVVMQIVQRRFRKADTEEALVSCRAASKILEQLLE